MLYIRRDLAPKVTAIFAALADLEASARAGAGNRGSGFALKLADGPELFARRGRRGGLARFITRDLYFGAGARPLRELAIANEARLRGIPIAEPLGVMIEAVAPGVYRSVFITRTLAGMNLWDFIRTNHDATVSARIIEIARRAIDTMHDAGLLHADLNLWNLFVTQPGEGPAIAILDFDKARLYNGPVPRSHRRRNFIRLARSLRKLDPQRRYFNARSVAILTAH